MRRGNSFRLPKLLASKKNKPENPTAAGGETSRPPSPPSSNRNVDVSVTSDCSIVEINENDAILSVEVIDCDDDTVDTDCTLKLSNRSNHRSGEVSPSTITVKLTASPSKKKRWNKRKKLAGPKKQAEVETPSVSSISDSSVRTGPSTKDGKTKTSNQPSKKSQRREQKILDDAIRGRLNGMDILSLGPASSALSNADVSGRTCSSMVADMMYTSGGKETPEMILEGYYRGGVDRWAVRMVDIQPPPAAMPESTPPGSPTKESKSSKISGKSGPSSQETDDESSFCESPTSVTKLWGEEISSPQSKNMLPECGGDYEDVLQLAAALSRPSDLAKEDNFQVTSSAELELIHDMARVSLEDGKFDESLQVFQKLLQGLEALHSNKPHYLVGSTRHNIGVIQMWQGKYQEALVSFQGAVANRVECLSPNHPDIAVSLLREAMASFALNGLDDALVSFDEALQMTPAKNSTRASILNNLGVVHFQRRDFKRARSAFSTAMKIQSALLEGQVRRDSLVFNSSVTLGNMGILHLVQKKYATAVFVFEEALQLRRASFRKDSDLVLESTNNLGYAKEVVEVNGSNDTGTTPVGDVSKALDSSASGSTCTDAALPAPADFADTTYQEASEEEEPGLVDDAEAADATPLKEEEEDRIGAETEAKHAAQEDSAEEEHELVEDTEAVNAKRVKEEEEARIRAEAEAVEAKSVKEEEDSRIRAESEAVEAKRVKEEEETRIRTEAEAAEALRAGAEAAEAKRLEEEENTRLRAEAAESKRLKEEEEARIRAEAEAVEAMRLKEEEEARIRTEAAEAKRLEEEEKARLRAEAAEAKRVKEEEEARLRAEAVEAMRLKEKEEARLRAEAEAVEAMRLKEEEEARLRAEAEAAEAKRVKEEESARLRAEAEAAEAKRVKEEEEARIRAEAEAAEAKRVKEEEVARLRAEAEAAEAKRLEEEDFGTEVADTAIASEGSTGPTTYTAIQFYTLLLQSQKEQFGPDSPQAMETTRQLVDVYMAERKYDDATDCLKSVVKWQEGSLPPTHPDLQRSKTTLQKLQDFEVCSIEC